MEWLAITVAAVALVSSAAGAADNDFFRPGDAFWCMGKKEQVEYRGHEAAGAANAVKAIGESLGELEDLAPEQRKIAVKSLMAALRTTRAALADSVAGFEEGIKAGCAKMWSAADVQEVDRRRSPIKAVEGHLDQLEVLLSTLP
jgi:hypothetical protein